MDVIELSTLRDELKKDAAVATDAFNIAQRRLSEKGDAALDSCAHHLARFYNIVEQMALRVASVFENSIADEKGWHAELIRRMTIRIGGVRPVFFPEEIAQELRELRAFRHVITHAYDLRLDPQKLKLLTGYAKAVAEQVDGMVKKFIDAVAREQGLELPND